LSLVIAFPPVHSRTHLVGRDRSTNHRISSPS
jgi:hypothetical protein